MQDELKLSTIKADPEPDPNADRRNTVTALERVTRNLAALVDGRNRLIVERAGAVYGQAAPFVARGRKACQST